MLVGHRQSVGLVHHGGTGTVAASGSGSDAQPGRSDASLEELRVSLGRARAASRVLLAARRTLLR